MGAAFKGFSSIKTKSRNDALKLDDVIDIITLPKNKYFTFRILPIMPLHVRQVWIKLWAGGKGKEKRVVSIPRYAINFDPNNPEKPKKGVKCPYMELAAKFEGQKEAPVRAGDFWLFNVIDREKQDEGAPRKSPPPSKSEKKTGFKDINTETWTPVRVMRLTSTSINRLQELSEENRVKDKKTKKTAQFDASDARYGFDVKIKFKPDAPGTDKYALDPAGGPSKLTDEEQSYLTWNLTEELLDATGRMTEEAAREDIKRMEVVGGEAVDDDEDEDDEDDRPRKGKKSKSTALDDDDDDDDEDDKPKKSKKSKDKKSSKDGKKSSKKSSKLDDDDDDDDDNDEEPKTKKSSKSKDKVKKSSKDSDKKSSKSSKEKSSKKSKKDEDEKPKKSSKDKAGKSSKSKKDEGGAKKKAKKTPSKKKKSDWDDDE
ncbi:single strand DNA binding protein [Pseudomonas phage Lu11]|uniref:single strand DNA binding protein n=1 Tax=Pseudomonas phage Lu11 TaxID=1161927 RepID=UPI00025F17D6|nr:single strand DNA binding protein [Pseudomonas phage Lu11]AFH14707.1 hypothetical protein Lu11_0172 [Pseudomonas phage Lu11]